MKNTDKKSKYEPNALKNFGFGIVGLALVGLIGGLYTNFDPIGGLLGIYSFFMISVICTGGVALIIWLPVLIIIGMIVRPVYNLIRELITGKKRDSSADMVEERTVSTMTKNHELSVIGYIVSARHDGLTDETIKANLKNTGGWADLDIANAFEKCSPRT